MATQPHTVSPMLLIETPHELDFPQREAAFFYGLFLRGHSPEQLRRDISVPPQVAAKWSREAERQPELRDLFDTFPRGPSKLVPFQLFEPNAQLALAHQVRENYLLILGRRSWNGTRRAFVLAVLC